MTVVGRAEENYAPDIPEPGSAVAIAKDTTDPRYTSSWIIYSKNPARGAIRKTSLI
ncbi:hypothetical protein L0222_19660 [bacterium]|nr:hypothetical protein [bacterium]MCI0602725.1 hypothetical protein [bacterium]